MSELESRQHGCIHFSFSLLMTVGTVWHLSQAPASVTHLQRQIVTWKCLPDKLCPAPCCFLSVYLSQNRNSCIYCLFFILLIIHLFISVLEQKSETNQFKQCSLSLSLIFFFAKVLSITIDFIYLFASGLPPTTFLSQKYTPIVEP